MHKQEIGNLFWVRTLKLLAKKGIKQSDLCKMLDMSRGTLASNIRRGSIPSANSAQRIAEALETSVEFLTTGNGTESEFFDPPELRKATRAVRTNETIRNTVLFLLELKPNQRESLYMFLRGITLSKNQDNVSS